VSLSAFVLVDAILLIGNHTISEYLRSTLPVMARYLLAPVRLPFCWPIGRSALLRVA